VSDEVDSFSPSASSAMELAKETKLTLLVISLLNCWQFL